MRVLLLNYEYPPCGSGAGIATAALAEGLASRGVSVDVVAGGERASSDPRLLWDGDADEEGLLTVHRVPSRRRAAHEAGVRGAVGYLAAATPLVRRLLAEEKYDVVHFVFSLPTAAMLPLLDLRETPVVVSLHGSDVPGYDAALLGVQRAHRLLHPLTSWIWRRADRVIVPSESLGPAGSGGRRQACATRWYRAGSISDGSGRGWRCAGSRTAWCAVWPSPGWSSGTAWTTSSMRSGFWNGAAISSRSPAAGPTRRRCAPGAPRGLEAHVRFAGWLDQAEVARRHRAADLFTLAPRVESFGNAFLEALASGLPIVGSTAGGIPELIEHERHGLLVPPGRPRELAHAISYLAADPRLRQEIGRRSRADAERTHSWDRMTTRHLALYNGVRRHVLARRPLAELPQSSW